jgi:hypothetical protein
VIVVFKVDDCSFDFRTTMRFFWIQIDFPGL